MKTCKDCLHYEACEDKFAGLCKIQVEEPKKHLELDPNVENRCLHFTDRSEWVRLPCKVGDIVYCVAEHCGGCHYYDDVLNKEEFDSMISACKKCKRMEIIKCNFTLDLFYEFGKTVFLTREEAEKALREQPNE